MSQSEVVRQSLEYQRVKAMNEAKLQATAQEKKDQAKKDAADAYFAKVQAGNKKIKKLNEFSNQVKSFAIETAISTIVDHIIEEQHGDERDMAIAHGVIKEAVKEAGYANLISRFAGKNLMLSQMASYCEDCCNRMMEAAKAKDSDDGDIDADPNYAMDKSIADDFVNKIKDLVPANTIKAIRTRVANSMDEFLNQQAENKSTIMDIYNKANEKAKNLQSNMVSESALESYKNRMKAKANSVYSRPTNLIGAMVRTMTENVYKDENLKKIYFDESGKLNMQLIINDNAVIYTVLETMNTTGMKDFTIDTIKEILNDSKL